MYLELSRAFLLKLFANTVSGSRGVFRTQTNIDDEAFGENASRLKEVYQELSQISKIMFFFLQKYGTTPKTYSEPNRTS